MNQPYEIEEAFYTAVGHMTVAWATVEIPLDVVCGIIFTRTAGARQYEPEIPIAFRRKIKFAKKCINNLEGLAPYREFAPDLLQRAADISDERHRLTHGMIDNFTPVAPGKIIMRKIIYKSDRHFVESKLIDIADIGDAIGKVVNLGSEMQALVSALLKQYRIGAPEQ